MSGHGHHDADADSHVDHHDHHETTSDDFPADEPRSPGWLPLLGGALFLAGILAFVVFGSDDKAAPATGASAVPPPPAAPAHPLGKPALRPAAPSQPCGDLPPGHEFVKRPAP